MKTRTALFCRTLALIFLIFSLAGCDWIEDLYHPDHDEDTPTEATDKNDPLPQYYTVTFNNNGGNTDAYPASRTVTAGRTAALPDTSPTKTGYTFADWNTAPDGSGTSFTASTSVTRNRTVYAQWTANSYTVSFGKNGGTTDASPMSRIASYGGTVALPDTAPTWAGRGFLGWWTENGSGGNWGAPFTASTPVTADTTVYAQWNPPPDT